MSREEDSPLALTHKPTEQEGAECPYLFENLEAIYYKRTPNKVTYYAQWRGQEVWS